VQIEILFCGICHSDLHSVRNEWSEFMATNYPIVPGHEIVGRVTKVGSITSTSAVTLCFPQIPIQKVNEAYERLLKSDVKYRFSIDMASLKSDTQYVLKPTNNRQISDRTSKSLCVRL